MLEKSNSVRHRLPGAGHLDAPEPDLTEWMRHGGADQKRAASTCTIGLVGKYVQLHDAYLSVAEALRHAGYRDWTPRWTSSWIDSETLTEDNVDAKPVAAGRHHRARRLWRPGHRGHDPRGAATPGNTASPISASAWACRSP